MMSLMLASAHTKTARWLRRICVGLGLVGCLCLCFSSVAQTNTSSNPASASAQAQNLSALEQEVALLEDRLEKLREVEAANAPPSPIWGWILGAALCLALPCLLWLLWLVHKMQEQQRGKTALAQIFAHNAPPQSPINTQASLSASYTVAAVPTPSNPIEHHAFVEDPDDLHIVEFEEQTLSDDEYDFGIGLGSPNTWQTAPVLHPAINTAPKTNSAIKHLADADLIEDDLLFVSTAASSEKFLQVEEMSDALQEAKFWVALHKIEHAITILEEEAVSAKGNNPASWMYLLDLYRQVGDKEKFQALRERFHRHFNGQIPAWQAELPAQKPRLADFPHIMTKLAHILQTEQAIPYLESLLLDDREGTREGFAYGVYCDIVQLLENVKQGRREMIFN